MTNAEIKERTLQLYAELPQDKEGRIARTDIRDEVLMLNYAFFGYVAKHTYISNTSISYEDKFQSAIRSFLEIWWWYKWAERYRTDLSFAVFFKPRISEMIDRELQEVKYSIRRALLIEAGECVGKHWAKVTYEDLSDPRMNLPPAKMQSLKAIFGSIYWADLESHALFIESPQQSDFIEDNIDDRYNTIEELLMHEMIQSESKINQKTLKEMSEIYDIDINLLKAKLPIAEKMLYTKLHNSLDMHS